MDYSQFNKQIERLKETFGEGKFGEERVSLIWREVKSFDAKWFEHAVDGFIGDRAFAPLMPEFRTETVKERERKRILERDSEANDAKAFMQIKFPDDDVRNIVQMCIKRITGGVPDTEWERMQGDLKHAGEYVQKVECERCEDNGILFWRARGYLKSGRCTCKAGVDKHGQVPLAPAGVKKFEACMK